jgi:hypothetical protein
MWLVEGLEGGRFAVLHKFHHTLVDGIASVNVIQTIFDEERDPQAKPEPRAGKPRRDPSRASARERRGRARRAPGARELARHAGAQSEGGRRPDGRRSGRPRNGGGTRRAALCAPRALQPQGRPHPRFAWQSEALDDFKAVKNALDGSLNDVVLAAVAGVLAAHLRARGEESAGLELQVFVPVALRGLSGGDRVTMSRA